MEDYAPCKRFEPLKAAISYFSSAALEPSLRQWVFDLTKANMQELYSTAWGWHDARKRKELSDQAARFLVVFTEGRPVGFVHLR